MAASREASVDFIFTNIKENDYLPTVDELLAYPEVLRKTYQDGNTLLHFAASSNKLALVNILLEADPTLIDIKNDLNQTPLHKAVKAVSPENGRILEALLQRGANPNLYDVCGRNAWRFALNCGQSILDMLKKYGAIPMGNYKQILELMKKRRAPASFFDYRGICYGINGVCLNYIYGKDYRVGLEILKKIFMIIGSFDTDTLHAKINRANEIRIQITREQSVEFDPDQQVLEEAVARALKSDGFLLEGVDDREDTLIFLRIDEFLQGLSLTLSLPEQLFSPAAQVYIKFSSSKNLYVALSLTASIAMENREISNVADNGIYLDKAGLDHYFDQWEKTLNENQIEDPVSFAIGMPGHLNLVVYFPREKKWRFFDYSPGGAEEDSVTIVKGLTTRYPRQSDHYFLFRLHVFATAKDKEKVLRANEALQAIPQRIWTNETLKVAKKHQRSINETTRQEILALFNTDIFSRWDRFIGTPEFYENDRKFEAIVKNEHAEAKRDREMLRERREAEQADRKAHLVKELRKIAGEPAAVSSLGWFSQGSQSASEVVVSPDGFPEVSDVAAETPVPGLQ